MSDVVIIFTPEKQTPPRKGAFYKMGIKLNPGRNVLKSAHFDKLSLAPDFQNLVSSDVLTVLKGKPPDDTNGQDLKSLAGFTVKEAETLIFKEFDPAVLKLWQSNEAKTKAREGVSNAIARQLNTIESGNL